MHSKAHSKNIASQVWFQLAIFIAVSSVAAVTSLQFKEKFSRYVPETITNCSALNKKASGSSGIYELTKAIGLKAHLWKLPYRDLKDVHGQLVIIGPDQSLANFERELILKWVAKGNSLLYLDQFSNQYSREILLPVRLWTRSCAPQVNVIAYPNESLTVSHFVGPTKVSYQESFKQIDNSTEVLKHDQDILLVEVQHGQGKILFGTAINLVANAHLKDSGSSFQLIANWLRMNNSTVYFDERCHGLSQGKNLITSALKGVGGVLFLQLFLILAISVASSAQKFGQRLSISNPRRISNLEFVNGIANSYRRAKATHLAADVLSHNLRLKLAKFLGQSTGDDEALAKIYLDSLKEGQNENERKDEQARLIKTLAASQQTDNKVRVSNQEMVEIAAYCDKIQETIDKTRQGNVHDSTVS
jgi:hypothetical protein